MADKYINPFTDFGRFSAAIQENFDEEENKDLLGDFIYNFSQVRQQYEASLKHYRDIENSLELQHKAGKKEGKEETILEIAKNAIEEGANDNFIAKITGLTLAQIAALRKK